MRNSMALPFPPDFASLLGILRGPMKGKFQVILLLVLLIVPVAEAHLHSNQLVDSHCLEGNPDKVFNTIFNGSTEKAKENLRDQLRDNSLIYLKAEQLLQRFDSDLESNTADYKVIDSPLYHKLVAARIAKESQLEISSCLYSRLLEQTQGFPGQLPDALEQIFRSKQEKSKVLVKEIHNYMAEQTEGADVISHLELAKGFQNSRYLFYGRQSGGRGSNISARVESELSKQVHNLGENLNQFTDFYRVHRKEVLAMAGSLSAVESEHIEELLKTSDPNFEQQTRIQQRPVSNPFSIEKNTFTFQNESLYSPNYDAGYNCIHPGPNGNITGNSFSEKGLWTITYDDGPHHSRSVKIAEMFAQANQKATFFWLAKNVESLPDVVRKVQDLGMDLANHSYTHSNLSKMTGTGLREEIIGANKALNFAYWPQDSTKSNIYFRLPYGAGVRSCSEQRRIIAEAGMVHLFWNVDSLDWQDKDPQSIYRRVVKQMENRGKGVVLFHDLHSQTVKVTEMILRYVERNNLTLSGISEVVRPEVYASKCLQETPCP